MSQARITINEGNRKEWGTRGGCLSAAAQGSPRKRNAQLELGIAAGRPDVTAAASPRQRQCGTFFNKRLQRAVA
jgi:hypothetical protein